MNKLSKKWKIIITAVVMLIGSFYGYYKVNNRNAFEEMYNSYYNILPIGSIDRMGQIEPIPRDNRGADIVNLHYKEKVDNSNVVFTLMIVNELKTVSFNSSTLIDDGVYLDIIYMYDMNKHNLKNAVSFRGENVPRVKDDQKQTKELLEKYNISKEYLQGKSDKLLDTVLNDWKRYSGSSYSKDNMGRLTIEKDEFLK